MSLTLPVPWHRGHSPLTASPMLGLSLCLDNSNKPNLDILLVCILALSSFKASLILFSTSF